MLCAGPVQLPTCLRSLTTAPPPLLQQQLPTPVMRPGADCHEAGCPSAAALAARVLAPMAAAGMRSRGTRRVTMTWAATGPGEAAGMMTREERGRGTRMRTRLTPRPLQQRRRALRPPLQQQSCQMHLLLLPTQPTLHPCHLDVGPALPQGVGKQGSRAESLREVRVAQQRAAASPRLLHLLRCCWALWQLRVLLPLLPVPVALCWGLRLLTWPVRLAVHSTTLSSTATACQCLLLHLQRRQRVSALEPPLPRSHRAPPRSSGLAGRAASRQTSRFECGRTHQCV